MVLYIAQSVMTRLWAGWPGNWSLIPGRGRDISLLHGIHIDSGSLPPFFNRYHGPFPWGWSDWDMKLTTHLHLVLKLRMHGTTPLFLLVWCLIKHQDFIFYLTIVTRCPWAHIHANKLVLERDTTYSLKEDVTLRLGVAESTSYMLCRQRLWWSVGCLPQIILDFFQVEIGSLETSILIWKV
jgi:hypothetical protein